MAYFTPRGINDGNGFWINREKQIVTANYRTSALNISLMLVHL